MKPLSHRLMSWTGRALVVAILGFIILPAIVVGIAAFNDKALLSFPPQQWSLRWFYKAVEYRDFRNGFHNGLIVMLASSFVALAVGAAFAFVLDRYEFRAKRLIEGLLLAPLVVPHFTVGLGLLILASQVNLTRGFAVVVICHVILVLPFVLRSVYISLRNLDQRLELAASSLGARRRACSAAGCSRRSSRSTSSRPRCSSPHSGPRRCRLRCTITSANMRIRPWRRSRSSSLS
jgi:putative spermidine/putrescine transport system permease protein